MHTSQSPAGTAESMGIPLRHYKVSKKGIELTIMVCGRVGLGKSTFVDTLCDGDVFSELDAVTTNGAVGTKELQLRSHRIDIAEDDGTVVHLTVVDAPGFGSQVDNRDSSKVILRYLEDQFDKVLREEARVCRNARFRDSRVHVCLYFLPPTGHGLRELDIELMKTLSLRVNVIPVIAKADTLTQSELRAEKEAIRTDISNYRIPIFGFDYDDPTDELSVKEADALRAMTPFAVAGSTQMYQENDEFLRVRRYPWGNFKIDSPYHCDFVVLRNVLLSSHLQELRDSTRENIYEKYRTEQLYKEPGLLMRLRQEDEEAAERLAKSAAASALKPLNAFASHF